MALSTEFKRMYDEFLAAWLHHEDLRHGGSIADLAVSRVQLDELRYRMIGIAQSQVR
jgi:hypothetical protein